MRRLGKRIVAITLAAAMMTSLTPQGMTFLQQEIVYAAETGYSIDGLDTFAFIATTDDPKLNVSWYGEKTIDAANATTDAIPTIGTTITTDLLIPTNGKAKADFIGTIKSQPLIYPNGACVAVHDWQEKTAADFNEKVTIDAKEYFKTTVTYTIKGTVGANNAAGNWTEPMDFGDAVKAPLTKVSIKIAGDKSNYNGTIAIANTKVNMPVQINSHDTYKFDVNSTWDEVAGNVDDAGKPKKKDAQQSGDVNTTEAPKVGTTLNVDVLLPVVEGKDKPDFSGVIKTFGVLRLGSDWFWLQSNDEQALGKDKFTEKVKAKDGTEYYKASVSYVFGEQIGANDPEKNGAWNGSASFEKIIQSLGEDNCVKGISIKIAGYQCNYNGTIAIANAKLTTPESELELAEPKVVSDLSSTEDYNKWKADGGYNYYHGGTENTSPHISYDSKNGWLKVGLDYSANSRETWSEAKVKCTASTPISIQNYNQLSVDMIYQGDKPLPAKVKFFAKSVEDPDNDNGVINVDGAVDLSNVIELENGYKKVKVTLSIKPQECTVQEITVGLIGYLTDATGEVYLDNLTLSQKSVADDYVEIVRTPNETGTQAILSEGSETIKLTDPKATDSAKALYAYLQKLDESNQVLFGHQNDVSKSVSPEAKLGDVQDVTGSVSGIFGIDSLALLGSEAGGTDAKTALDNSVKYSKTAADNGAIITLSTHMPNFTNAKITKNEDGTYNFYNCDFAEAKDTSNESLKKILPGGEKNDVYRAYLDTIAAYAKELETKNIPILFRPLHENTGSWFWWGSTNSAESYKSLYRYTRDYLESKDVHNMLYVYSPNGPLTSEEEYLTRYPGDEYVDILAFDYYNDYNTYPATYDKGAFFENLNKTCKVVSGLAKQRGKIAAISETGARVQKKTGDNEGLLVKDNPITKAKSGVNWYQKVSDIAKDNNMPYYLVWANFGDTNFYVPYKYNSTLGQEMINDFIDYYNDSSSVFGNGTNFYSNINKLKNVTAEKYNNPYGYMVSPFDLDTILDETELTAYVENATSVKFVITDTATDKTVTLNASKNEQGLYAAKLTKSEMDELGKTNVASITLFAENRPLARIENLSIGTTKPVAPKNVVEDFEYYFGSEGLLDVTYTTNSAAGCSSTLKLSKVEGKDGDYAGAFSYTFTGEGAYTGRIKAANYDFSGYNALQMWVKPDGKGQKLIIQIADGSGEEFEVDLAGFVKGTDAKYVTIPFSSFIGKHSGKLDTSSISKFAIYCNQIDNKELTSSIYFDNIQAVNITDADTKDATIDASGLIFTDTAIGSTEAKNNTGNSGSTDSGNTVVTNPDGSTSTTTTTTKPDGSTVETVTTTKPDGTSTIVVSEQEKNEAGKTVEVTTTTEKDAEGNVTGTTEKSVIADAAKNTSATVTVTTDNNNNNVTATAEVTKEGIKVPSGTRGTIAASVIAQITEAAGTTDVTITQTVTDSKGKELYTVTMNASDAKAGTSLTIVKLDEKTGEYVLVNKKEYPVTKAGNVVMTIKNSGDYMLISKADATALIKKILKTVKPAASSKTVKKGKSTTFTFSKSLNMKNVAKITYVSSNSSVAKVSKTGKITAKKVGTVTIKAKVTLKDGSTKTVSMKIKVK